MTLIIGLVDGGQVHFESDSLITQRWLPEGCDANSIDLKLQPKVRLFSDERFVVAAAGNPDPLFELARDHLQTKWELEQLRDHLLFVHRQTLQNGGSDTDFLLGCADPISLFAFKRGNCRCVEMEEFIGDEVAYNWLAEKRAEPIGSLTPETRIGRLSHEFPYALNHPDFPSVGGVNIGLQSYKGRFHFKERTFQTASFDFESNDFLGIDPNSFESLSFVPIDDRKKLRVCFPESERCYEFQIQDDGSQLPVLVS